MASKSTRTRKALPTVPEVYSFTDLRSFIQSAASTTGEYQLRVDLSFTSLKGATDLIRRMPRVKGWQALSVKVNEATDTSALLTITNAGETATAWPVKATAAKQAPAKQASKASKAPAVSKRNQDRAALVARTKERSAAASVARQADKEAVVTASKAPAKRTRKATAK